MKNKIEIFLKKNGVTFPCQAIMWMSEGNYLVKIFSDKAFCRIIEKFDDINLNEDGDDEESGSWEKLLEIVEFLDDESDSNYIFIESDFRIEINGKKFDPTIEVSPEVFPLLKEVAITGTFSFKRDELAEKLFALGFKLVKTPTKKTEIMLVGEKTASLEKIKKAEKLGMRIIRGFDSDLVLNQLTSSSINLGENDFVKFKKGGECNICGKRRVAGDLVDVISYHVEFSPENCYMELDREADEYLEVTGFFAACEKCDFSWVKEMHEYSGEGQNIVELQEEEKMRLVEPMAEFYKRKERREIYRISLKNEKGYMEEWSVEKI